MEKARKSTKKVFFKKESESGNGVTGVKKNVFVRERKRSSKKRVSEFRVIWAHNQSYSSKF